MKHSILKNVFFQINLTNTISKNRVRDIPINGLFFLTLAPMLVEESRSTWSWSTKIWIAALPPTPGPPVLLSVSNQVDTVDTDEHKVPWKTFNTKWADFSLITTMITGQHKKISWTVKDAIYNDILYSWIEEQFCKDFILLKNVSYL